MPHADLFRPLTFTRGPAWKNRLMLAPLTNQQSFADGRLSDDEYHWLTMRAEGGFSLTSTCAAHVQANGQGFPGQLGIWSDDHLEGLTRLAAAIKARDSVALAQLHHAGNRAIPEAVSDIVCPSDDPETHARALTTAEVEDLVEAFVAAAVRADKAGFDAIEIHCAHGYILGQFLSPKINRRDDRYGGSLENRARIVWEIVEGVRKRCRPDLQLGVRISPERFGQRLPEMVELARQLLADGRIDFLDLSLWDVFKEPADEAFQGRTLLSYFTELPRGACRLGGAGKVTTPTEAARLLEAGCDFAVVGRSAILHHDWALRARDPAWTPLAMPVSAAHLRAEGVSETFLTYLRDTFKMVEPEPA